MRADLIWIAAFLHGTLNAQELFKYCGVDGSIKNDCARSKRIPHLLCFIDVLTLAMKLHDPSLFCGRLLALHTDGFSMCLILFSPLLTRWHYYRDIFSTSCYSIPLLTFVLAVDYFFLFFSKTQFGLFLLLLSFLLIFLSTVTTTIILDLCFPSLFFLLRQWNTSLALPINLPWFYGETEYSI